MARTPAPRRQAREPHPQPNHDNDDEDSASVLDFTPVTFLRNRRSGWVPERQRAFIEILAQSGTVAFAARAVGMSRRSAYKLLERPGAESFAAAFDVALEMGFDAKRGELMGRARFGEVVPRFRNGRLVGYVHRYDIRAGIAVLAARDVDFLARREEAARVRAYRKSLAQAEREKAEVEQANLRAWEEAERAWAERRQAGLTPLPGPGPAAAVPPPPAERAVPRIRTL